MHLSRALSHTLSRTVSRTPFGTSEATRFVSDEVFDIEPPGGLRGRFPVLGRGADSGDPDIGVYPDIVVYPDMVVYPDIGVHPDIGIHPIGYVVYTPMPAMWGCSPLVDICNY